MLILVFLSSIKPPILLHEQSADNLPDTQQTGNPPSFSRFNFRKVHKSVWKPIPTIHKPTQSLSKTGIETIDLTKNVYSKRIILKTSNNQTSFHQYCCSIKINTLELIQEIKVSFSEDQMFFTLDDRKTRVPHFVEYGFGTLVTKIWLQLPVLPIKQDIALSLFYGPGLSPTQHLLSDFSPPDPSIVAHYSFDDVTNLTIPDISGNSSECMISSNYDDSRWSYRGEDFFHKGTYDNSSRFFIMFNDWQKWYDDEKSVYLTMNMTASNHLSEQGALATNFIFYEVSEEIVQILFTDSQQQMVLGFLPDRKVFLQLGNTTNRYVWNCHLKQNIIYHLALSWDFTARSLALYIDGQPVKPYGSNTGFRFTKINPFSSFLFGGIPTFQKEYGFCGWVEYLELYNRVITKKDIAFYRQQNSFTTRFPDLSIGKLETIDKGQPSLKQVDLKKISQYPLTDAVKVNLVYSNPKNNYYSWEDAFLNHYENNDESTNIVNSLGEKPHPVFGFYSHFYPDVGTEITVKKNVFVYYLGFQVNNPLLIKDISVNFLWLSDYGQLSYHEDLLNEKYDVAWDKYSWLDWLIPTAKACGPFYGYYLLGESNLTYCYQTDNIVWYRLDQPLSIDPSALIMQLAYHPSDETGLLLLQLKEMICLTNQEKLVRATLYQEIPTELIQRNRGAEEYFQINQYKAAILPTIKGSIELSINHENGIDIAFKNEGRSDILFDIENRLWIERNILNNIQIMDSDRLLMTATIDQLIQPIWGETLLPGEMFTYTLLYPFELEKNKLYDFLINTPEGNDETLYEKIYSWTIGPNPYAYDLKYQANEVISYFTFWVDSNKKIHISSRQPLE